MTVPVLLPDFFPHKDKANSVSVPVLPDLSNEDILHVYITLMYCIYIRNIY